MKAKIFFAIIAVWLLVDLSAADVNLPNVKFEVNPQPDSSFFFSVWDFVRAQYFYTKPLPEDSLLPIWRETKRAISANPGKNDSLIFDGLSRLTATTPDDHTYFLNPEETAEWKKQLSGDKNISGVGIILILHQEKIKILDVIANSPAIRAGLKRGDQIIKVDQKDISGLSIGEVSALIRGTIGTSVTLTIQEAGGQELRTITIIRGEVVMPRMKWQVLDTNVYYLKLYDFSFKASEQFSRALDSLGVDQNGSPSPMTPDNSQTSGSPTKKVLIFDLRGNPGGYTSEAAMVLGFWTDQITFYIWGKKMAMPNGCRYPVQPLANFKTIILTDRGTASASEIVTAALDEYGFATVVGDTTYGKGCFQNYYQLPLETSIGITSGIWLTPGKICIDKIGIAPDFYAEFDLDLWMEQGIDNQLRAALNVAKIK